MEEGLADALVDVSQAEEAGAALVRELLEAAFHLLAHHLPGGGGSKVGSCFRVLKTSRHAVLAKNMNPTDWDNSVDNKAVEAICVRK